MNRQQKKLSTRIAQFTAILLAGSVFQVGGCDGVLIDLTRVIDPCGTILANCAPGSFFANTVEIGSYEAQCFDPTCTLPGQCGNIPLGSFQDPCR